MVLPFPEVIVVFYTFVLYLLSSLGLASKRDGNKKARKLGSEFSERGHQNEGSMASSELLLSSRAAQSEAFHIPAKSTSSIFLSPRIQMYL